MDGLGKVLVWLGVLGLVVGILPLAVVAVVNPKSTAVGPGLLMVAMVPISFVCWAAGAGLRKVARWRAGRRRADDEWRFETSGIGRRDRAA
jgi:hypothetical protein